VPDANTAPATRPTPWETGAGARPLRAARRPAPLRPGIRLTRPGARPGALVINTRFGPGGRPSPAHPRWRWWSWTPGLRLRSAAPQRVADRHCNGGRSGPKLARARPLSPRRASAGSRRRAHRPGQAAGRLRVWRCPRPVNRRLVSRVALASRRPRAPIAHTCPPPSSRPRRLQPLQPRSPSNRTAGGGPCVPRWRSPVRLASRTEAAVASVPGGGIDVALRAADQATLKFLHSQFGPGPFSAAEAARRVPSALGVGPWPAVSLVPDVPCSLSGWQARLRRVEGRGLAQDGCGMCGGIQRQQHAPLAHPQPVGGAPQLVHATGVAVVGSRPAFYAANNPLPLVTRQACSVVQGFRCPGQRPRRHRPSPSRRRRTSSCGMRRPARTLSIASATAARGCIPGMWSQMLRYC